MSAGPLMLCGIRRKWQKKFQSQVTKAYQLLKKYEDKAIINALNSYRGKFIYSLRVKTLEKLIQKEQSGLDKIDLKGSSLRRPHTVSSIQAVWKTKLY
jgi:hypothetical protein